MGSKRAAPKSPEQPPTKKQRQTAEAGWKSTEPEQKKGEDVRSPKDSKQTPGQAAERQHPDPRTTPTVPRARGSVGSGLKPVVELKEPPTKYGSWLAPLGRRPPSQGLSSSYVEDPERVTWLISSPALAG